MKDVLIYRRIVVSQLLVISHLLVNIFIFEIQFLKLQKSVEHVPN
jgi:hypothetical protein